MTDWPAVHESVVKLFTEGWRAPGAHAWDDLLAEEMIAAQPMLRYCRTRRQWGEETARQVLSRPAAWPAWWRSGIGPFVARRRFVGRR